MENKKKPSLSLVGNHLKIDEPGIPFTEDMLTWPILAFIDYPEPCPDIARNTILKNAMSALNRLSPFQAKISVTAETEQKLLCYEKRTWCKIFLNEENVLTFSHHSQKENKAFFELAEWVELEEKNTQNAQQEVFAELARWSAEDWITFFQQRIIARAKHLRTKAKNKKEDAEKLEDSADKILMSVVETSF